MDSSSTHVLRPGGFGDPDATRAAAIIDAYLTADAARDLRRRVWRDLLLVAILGSALAVTTQNRTAILPEAATLAEQGMPKFEAIAWTALLGPAGLAPETIATVNRIVNEFLSSDEGRAALLNFGMEPLGGTAEDLAGFMASELTKWRTVAERMTPE